VKSFVAWHVRLTCQMLTTNVASCKRVGRPQGLNMPPICERQSPLPVETATLTVALPSFPGNIRNICIFLKRKAMEGKNIHKADKSEKTGTQVKKRFEREPGENHARRKPDLCGAGARHSSAMPHNIWFFLLLAWPGFKPKARNPDM